MNVERAHNSPGELGERRHEQPSDADAASVRHDGLKSAVFGSEDAAGGNEQGFSADCPSAEAWGNPGEFSVRIANGRAERIEGWLVRGDDRSPAACCDAMERILRQHGLLGDDDALSIVGLDGRRRPFRAVADQDFLTERETGVHLYCQLTLRYRDDPASSRVLEAVICRLYTARRERRFEPRAVVECFVSGRRRTSSGVLKDDDLANG